jgi:putative oxidoreductase
MPVDVPPKKILPSLAWYTAFEPYTLAFIRFCLGALIVPHGIDRLFLSGAHAELRGYLASIPSAVGVIELVGGVLLALGLLTRPVALLLAIEWISIAWMMPFRPGTNWLMLGATPHYPAFVGGLCLIFAFRGGGYYSLDRLLGKEF